MRILIIVIILIGSIVQINAQRELTISEMNSDGAAVIEINGEDPQANGFKQMLLGFNPSSGAWLRTTTDDPLSFWTKDELRMTVTNWGGVIIKNLEETTNSQGARPVYANQNGLLYRQEPVTQYMTLAGNSFDSDITYSLANSNGFTVHRTDFSNLDASSERYQYNSSEVYISCQPSLPYTKYKITRCKFYFYDNDGNNNFTFEIVGNESPPGSSLNPNVGFDGTTIKEIIVDIDIDQSQGEFPLIRVYFPRRDSNDSLTNMKFYKAVLSYRQIL